MARVRVTDIASLREAVVNALDALLELPKELGAERKEARKLLERILTEIDSGAFTPKAERSKYMFLGWLLTGARDLWPDRLADLFGAIETYYVRRLP